MYTRAHLAAKPGACERVAVVVVERCKNMHPLQQNLEHANEWL